MKPPPPPQVFIFYSSLQMDWSNSQEQQRYNIDISDKHWKGTDWDSIADLSKDTGLKPWCKGQDPFYSWTLVWIQGIVVLTLPKWYSSWKEGIITERNQSLSRMNLAAANLPYKKSSISSSPQPLLPEFFPCFLNEKWLHSDSWESKSNTNYMWQ